SDNGTIFHLRRFLSYHKKGRFKDSSYMIYDNKKLLALLPAADYKREDGKRILSSHPGASYGGVLIDGKMGLKDTFRIVDTIVDHAREENHKRISLTQPPIYYYKKKSSIVDYALNQSGFKPVKRELSGVLSVIRDNDRMFKTFPNSVKRAIKKAETNGLKVSQSFDIEKYYEILKDNLEMRHNVKPTHSLNELKKLMKLFPRQIKLFGVFKNEEMIAGVLNIGCSKLVNLAFYIAHVHEHQEDRPVDLAIWKAIQQTISEGYRYLDLGTFTLKMEINWGLCKFKEKFGARGIFRDTYECKL
ncbi:MAG: GNAT family N-acetyltransferase, partial [bacterium]|nr:GNAT family N-acetyltransferase [bacterium]